MSIKSKKNALTLFSLVVLLLTSTVFAVPCTDSLDNDTEGTAAVVTVGNPITDLTLCSDDLDYFTISQPANTVIEFRFSFTGATDATFTDNLISQGVTVGSMEDSTGDYVDYNSGVFVSQSGHRDFVLRAEENAQVRNVRVLLSPSAGLGAAAILQYTLTVNDITSTAPTCGTATPSLTLPFNGDVNICDTGSQSFTFNIAQASNLNIQVTFDDPLQLNFTLLRGATIVTTGVNTVTVQVVQGAHTLRVDQTYPFYNAAITLTVSATAVPSCNPVCDATHGTCKLDNSSVSYCECQTGWQGDDCSQQIPTATCLNNCSGNGECIVSGTVGTCSCTPDWEGADCSKATRCPGNPTQCSAHGACIVANGTKRCDCQPGWGGIDCASGFCDPICTTHGICDTNLALNKPYCKCDAGWQGTTCSEQIKLTECPNACSGHGICYSNTTSAYCACDSAWTGSDCSQQNLCPGTPQCNARGNCVTTGTNTKVCECLTGWSGPDCSTGTCTPDCVAGHGYCNTVSVNVPFCSCYTGWQGVTCADVVTSGSCPDNCSGHGSCSGGTCTCADGWKGQNCATPDVCPGLIQCSDHGSCQTAPNGTKVCVCQPGWKGADCAIGFCEPACDQGSCVTVDIGTPYCECAPGWNGSTCSSKITSGACSKDCSGRGVCNTSSDAAAVCVCNQGYKGYDCSIATSCPGTLSQCSGNGFCVYDTDNGKVCICSAPYSGSDCATNLSTEDNEKTTKADSNSNLPIIIGASIGGVVLLLCLVMIAAFFIGRATYRKKRQSGRDFELATNPGSGSESNSRAYHGSQFGEYSGNEAKEIKASISAFSTLSGNSKSKNRPLPPPPGASGSHTASNQSSYYPSAEPINYPHSSSSRDGTPGVTPLDKLPRGLVNSASVTSYLSDSDNGKRRNKNKGSEINYDELTLIQEIGRGAFGVVFRAKWRETTVAVKQLKTVDLSARKLEEFRAEAELLKNLRPHPNVVLFLGITAPPSPISIITEYCGGGSLWAKVRKNEVGDYPTQLRVFYGIAKGMLHLHSEDIIHRDLAARNILLTHHNEVKVTDFGMSRELSEDENVTKSDVGPLKWMAPESISERSYSVKTDVYSFGVLIWEVLTGKEPFSDLDSLGAAFKVVTEGLRPPIPEDCPAVLTEIMKKCWEKDPEARPTFKELCKVLSAALSEVEGSYSGRNLYQLSPVPMSVSSETNSTK